MDITLVKEQRQVLGQQMQQSIQLLQMSAQEIESYLERLAEENPLIEIKSPREEITRPLQAFSSGLGNKPKSISLDDTWIAQTAQNYETIRGAVLEQIGGMRVPAMMRRELRWLAGELDERGYLPVDAGDLLAFGGSRERYENAVKVMQSLEPAGVGARNLSECLCIQLSRLGVTDKVPYRICGQYLERLAKGQLNHIARELGLKIEEVAEAKKLIASLNPHPSNGYTGGEAVSYVLPDVEVLPDGSGGFDVVPADRYMPTYGIDAFYAQMAEKETLTEEERDYFRAKLSQARWAISCVSRRRDMLTVCTRAIVESQKPFFLDGISPLKPLTMTELAERLGVHPSTVSRAVKKKYLYCRWGVYPLSRFFAQEIGGMVGGTGTDLTENIRQLIAEEDPAHPVSDRMIAQMLSRRGLEVSRRTVAKYREAAAIRSAAARRER